MAKPWGGQVENARPVVPGDQPLLGKASSLAAHP